MKRRKMKLAKAQAQWVDTLIAAATTQEEELLKSKREKLRDLGVAFSQLRTAEAVDSEAVQNYIKMTGESKKAVIAMLKASPSEAHILFDIQKQNCQVQDQITNR